MEEERLEEMWLRLGWDVRKIGAYWWVGPAGSQRGCLVAERGGALECTCPAYQRRRQCEHVMVVEHMRSRGMEIPEDRWELS